ncbi:MAG: TonB-dependent receptor [Niabella sp.]
MKLTVVYILLASFQCIAFHGVGQERISLDMKNVTIETVLKEITQKSKYNFVYKSKMFSDDVKVDVFAKDATIDYIMEVVLKNTSFGYEKTAPNLIAIVPRDISFNYLPSWIIHGIVLNENGTPIVGVSVNVLKTNKFATTDDQGRFMIEVESASDSLLFTYVGYKPLTIAVGAEKEIEVKMMPDVEAQRMEEVIAVAYGTQKKSSVTGSVATINSASLTTVTTPNVNAMLQGKVAGVQVLNTSGRPGDAAVIRIRGKSSLGADNTMEPLWVIDGVVSGTGAQLNPNEIESISILKDASASALYGSRATNGVILVTTKSGRTGENTIRVSSKLGFANQNLGNFRLMDAQELYDYTIGMPGALNSYPWLNDKDALLSHNTNWFDFATHTGVSQNHTISHTIGTEKMRNYLSVDYYNESGTVKGYDFKRFSLRDNIDYSFNSRLKVHLKLAGSYRNDEDRQHSIYSAMTYLPWDYPINPDGTVRTGKETGMGTALDWHGRDMSNYLYNNQFDYSKSKQIGINSNLGFDYRITKWLVFESNNNIGFRFQRELGYTDPRSIGSESTGGQLVNNSYLTTTRYTNQLLRFNKVFNSLHNLNAFLGYEFSDYLYENTDATGQSIPINSEVLNVAAKAYSTKGTKYANATESFYFNTNYVYNDKYSAQFSFRRDGSSKFGPDNRYGNFWTVGGAWSLDKEHFMDDLSFVDFLKLRASYGSIGNSSSLGNYSYLSVYGLDKNYVGIPAAFPNVLGNPSLTWEKCFETNFALEGSLFKRLNFTIEYYIKNTSDLLYSRKLSALTGYNSRYENIGALRNNGIEVSLSGDIIALEDWQWSAGVNFGYNKNKITELANNNADQFPDDVSNKIFRVGEDRDAYYLPEWAGVDVYTGAPLWYAYDPQTGTRSVVTNRANATYVLAGSATPKYSGGVQTSITYKQLTLSAIGAFAGGNKIYHAARQFYDNDGAYPTYNSMSLSSNSDWVRWQKPGDIATHPQAIAGGNNGSNEKSTRYLENGSYFRLTNTTLAYNVHEKLLGKAGIKAAQIYVSGENLWTLTKFSGADVEAGIGKSNGDYATDLYPSVRRFSVGINLSF